MHIHRLTAVVLSFVVIGAAVTAVSAPAAADTTVTTFSSLAAAFTSAVSGPTEHVTVGAAIQSTTGTLTLPANADLDLDLGTFAVQVQNIVLSPGSDLSITGASAGKLIALGPDATNPPANSAFAGIQTSEATLNISGSASVSATGGTGSAGIGGKQTNDISLNNSSGTLNFSGSSSVTAIGGQGGAGIGGGINTSQPLDGGVANFIEVSGDATVTASVVGGAGEPIGSAAGSTIHSGYLEIDDDAQVTTLSNTTSPASIDPEIFDDGILSLGSAAGPTISYDLEGGGIIEGAGTIENLGNIYNELDVDVPVTGNNFVVKFHDNDGDGTSTTVRVYGTSFLNTDTPLPTPTRPGYAFTGWYGSAAATGSSLSAGTTLTRDRVVYAQWLPEPSKVTVSGSAFKKHAHPKVKVTVGKLPDGSYATGDVDIYVNSSVAATATLTSAKKGVISVTLPAESASISVKAVYEGNDTTAALSSSVVKITAK